MSSDHQYYATRAVEERCLAISAENPKVRQVHLELAANYALLAGPKVSDNMRVESESRAA